ncbi:glycoside hydrolase [Streptomyces sp. SID10853]|uniref:C40 family peptidase n=1 Tax=Streptomyces sp. SID10853 TaxID=2706028 RepID=UPI0013C117D9|nr:C40 family peptidase [Streptomyces sp. SID10853]NDZ80742.1 glycoside hydrolase [Streptomyces sp. SID10853]
MATHRKPRSRVRSTAPALGITTAALASVSLFAQTAGAAPAPGAKPAPKPGIEEVQKKVDGLYRQAGTATQQYNQAQEATTAQRKTVDSLLDQVAERTAKVNDSRRTLGNYAAAQYREGTLSTTATLLLADNPQSYFDQDQLMKRLGDRQEKAVADYQAEQRSAARKRGEAARSLESLTESQAALKASKQSVQSKLADARRLLSKLTAEEKARLAALEKKKEAEARRKAEKLAQEQAAAAKKRKASEQAKGGSSGTGSSTGSGSSSGSGSGTSSGKAATALAFARAQIGKPYVWGATGPGSYDCSGLTQAAWKAAGVNLPRTTWDQVKTGTRVATKDLRPGDLVFFYDDISHVGMYIGNGMMIHAPKPGAYVREESIYYMPIYGSVRPG